MEPIRSAVEKRQRSLSEHQAKEVIRAYEIPTADEVLVQTAAEAAEAAEALGWPVALKACGPDILHKTDAGLIALGVSHKEALDLAFDRIDKAAGGLATEGMLVQAMVPGAREVVLGMKREPQFGACVMVGLGGIMAEVFKDTAFRVAPFDRIEALDMIQELRCKDLLAAFRGQAPADTDALAKAVLALGRIAEDFPMITEIDINPVKIRPDGTLAAVDALIILGNGTEDDSPHQ